MERAYDDAKYGHFSRRPYIDMIIPTLVDPSMAPPGKHVMSCFVQYAPYHLAPGRRLGRRTREAFGDAVIDTIAEFAPEHPQDIIVGRQVLTPLDIERDVRPHRGQHLPGRAVPGAALLQPAGARLGALPDADPRPLDVRLGDAPGRRDHGRAGPAGRARDPARVPGTRPAGRRDERHASGAWDAIVVGGGHNGLTTRGLPGPGRPAHARPGAPRPPRRRRRHRRAGPRRAGADARPHGRAAAPVDVYRELGLKGHGLTLVQPGGARSSRRSRTAAR